MVYYGGNKMSDLNPNLLHVRYMDPSDQEGPLIPRSYTLTHSDTTGELFLTIGKSYDRYQISGIYSRLMRDEVLAEWKLENQTPSLHVYCYISGGLVIGSANWRYKIFKRHMRMVLEAFYYGDRSLGIRFPEIDKASVFVHFQSKVSRLNKIEDYGLFSNFQMEF